MTISKELREWATGELRPAFLLVSDACFKVFVEWMDDSDDFNAVCTDVEHRRTFALLVAEALESDE